MDRQDGAYKKDKRTLVLFVLGAVILATGWFTQTPPLGHSSYFWLQPKNHTSPLVITTVQGRSVPAGFPCELSKSMTCAEIPPRLAIFFGLPLPLNRADYVTLTMLPGIGQKRAGNIIRFRAEQGRITDTGMLARVDGISQKLSGRLGPMLCFN